MSPASMPSLRSGKAALVTVALLAFAVRALPLLVWPWSSPAATHHIDEHFLPFEALAQWEGVTPREIGWPAATTRLALSAAYAVDLAATEVDSLSAADSAADAMTRIATWSAVRRDEPARLFVIARALSIAIGVAAVVAMYWATARWLGPGSAMLAALIVAVSPLAVTHSQLILADMTGVLFVTCALGLWGRRPTRLRPIVITGVLVGLAVASKHHFAIWLLPAAAWAVTGRTVAKPRALGSLLGSALLSYLVLVPWPWLNPVLFVKEFAAVVGEKVVPSGTGFWPFGPALNLWTGLMALGWLATAGLVVAAVFLWRRRDRRWLPPALAVTVGLVVLGSARIMHARYALLLLPALALLSAAAFDHLFRARRRIRRRSAYVLFAGLTLATGLQVVSNQIAVGALPPAVQAGLWLEEFAVPGQRIAVQSVFPYHLPRTRAQLLELIAQSEGESAYLRKMASNGYQLAATSQPFHAAVLCDERYAAHWYLRELSIRAADEGFEVTLYDAGPRFHSMPETEARRLFVAGLDDAALGFDYFLTTRPLEPDHAAARTFSSPGAKPLHLYAR